MAYSDWVPIVEAKLRDTAGPGGKVSPQQVQAAITEAANRYSRHRPRVAVLTLIGDGILVTHALPAAFEDGFSTIREIEYPVDRQEPEYLDEADYRVYRDPATGALKLRLLALVLGLTVKAYVGHTARHQVTEVTPGVDTVPLIDRDAVASLAAAICLEQLAAFYLGTGDPTLGMATVAYKTKSQECLDVARALKAEYREHVGVSDGVVAASVSRDVDVAFAGGGPRFYHGGRDR